MNPRAAPVFWVLRLALGLLALAGWGAFFYAVQSSAEAQQQLTEHVAELKRGQERLRAERDQARAEVAELRASRDQLVAERVEAQAPLALAREEIARLQKQVEQLQAKASVTGSVRAPTPSGTPARSPTRPQKARRRASPCHALAGVLSTPRNRSSARLTCPDDRTPLRPNPTAMA